MEAKKENFQSSASTRYTEKIFLSSFLMLIKKKYLDVFAEYTEQYCFFFFFKLTVQRSEKKSD